MCVFLPSKVSVSLFAKNLFFVNELLERLEYGKRRCAECCRPFEPKVAYRHLYAMNVVLLPKLSNLAILDVADAHAFLSIKGAAHGVECAVVVGLRWRCLFTQNGGCFVY